MKIRVRQPCCRALFSQKCIIVALQTARLQAVHVQNGKRLLFLLKVEQIIQFFEYDIRRFRLGLSLLQSKRFFNKRVHKRVCHLGRLNILQLLSYTLVQCLIFIQQTGRLVFTTAR